MTRPPSVTVLFSQQEQSLLQTEPPPHRTRVKTQPPASAGRRQLRRQALSEDVVGLVLHQHLHAPHVAAPEAQAVPHARDLSANQDRAGVRHSGHRADRAALMRAAGLGQSWTAPSSS